MQIFRRSVWVKGKIEVCKREERRDGEKLVKFDEITFLSVKSFSIYEESIF